MLFGLVGAAALLVGQGDRERAAQVAALVCRHPAANRETKNRAEGLLDQLQAHLPGEVMAAAQERGRAQKLEDVTADMLEWAQSRLSAPAN
jgi:hypothetical protein